MKSGMDRVQGMWWSKRRRGRASKKRIYVLAGTSTSPGGQLALRSLCEYLANQPNLDVVAVVPKSLDLVRLPRSIKTIRRSRFTAIATDFWGPFGKYDVVIGATDRLPFRRLKGDTILVIQNLHLYNDDERISLAPFSRTRLQQLWARLSAERAKNIVASTNAAAQAVVQKFNISPAKIRVEHIPPVDVPPPKKFHRQLVETICMVGDARGYKRFDWAIAEIDAWATMLDRKVEITHIGGVSNSPSGRALLQQANNCLKANVSLLGMLDHERAMKVLSSADLFVFPSAVEAFGIPLVEALQAGVPVVCAKIPAFEEIGADSVEYFDGTEGSLVRALTNVDSREVREQYSRTGFSMVSTKAGWDVLG